MIGGLLAMLGLSRRDEGATEKLRQQEVALQQERQLRRLAQTEFVENLYAGVVSELGKRDGQNGHFP